MFIVVFVELDSSSHLVRIFT